MHLLTMEGMCVIVMKSSSEHGQSFVPRLYTCVLIDFWIVAAAYITLTTRWDCAPKEDGGTWWAS